MANCPSCGKGYCYFPFYGPPECVNSDCKFFDGKHYLAMKSEIEKKPEHQTRFSELYQRSTGSLPAFSDVFGAYPSGPYKKP